MVITIGKHVALADEVVSPHPIAIALRVLSDLIHY